MNFGKFLEYFHSAVGEKLIYIIHSVIVSHMELINWVNMIQPVVPSFAILCNACSYMSVSCLISMIT